MKSLNSLRNLIFCFGAPLFLMLLMSAVAVGDEPPAWLKQAAAMSVPTYGKDVYAVVLHHEQRKNVEEGGKITTTTLYAVKILAREGRGEAIAHAVYNTDSEKVK